MQGGFYFALTHSISAAHYIAEHSEVLPTALITNLTGMAILAFCYIGIPLILECVEID